MAGTVLIFQLLVRNGTGRYLVLQIINRTPPPPPQLGFSKGRTINILQCQYDCLVLQPFSLAFRKKTRAFSTRFFKLPVCMCSCKNRCAAHSDIHIYVHNMQYLNFLVCASFLKIDISISLNHMLATIVYFLWMRSSRVVGAYDKLATVLGWIPASSDTAESEGQQMKQC
jgi:hypothetical protein